MLISFSNQFCFFKNLENNNNNNKQVISHMRKLGQCYERVNLRENRIPSDSSKKQHHKDYVKAIIDKMQQNSRCRLCGDRDEIINHISKCSKLAQKKSIRLDTTGWGRWFTARSLNLTIWTNGIYSTQNLYTNFSGILK